jgi:gliding motility-associated-like protein
LVHYEFYPEISQTCAVMYTIDITIDPEIKAVFTQIPNICQTTTAPALPLTSDNGVTGTWNPATIDTSVAGTFHFDFVVDAGQTCALPPDNGGMDIVIDPIITPTFTAIADVCINTTAPILPLTSDNGITGTWTPPTVDMTVAGTVSYMFTPDAGQCAITPVTPSLTVTVTPLTVPDFANIANMCSGTTAPVLATTSPNGVTGTWNAPINTALIGTTAYTFTPTAGLCAATQTLNVTIIQTLTPDFAPIPAFCAGTTAPLLATTSPNGVIGTWSPAVISNTANGTYTFTPSTIPGQCAVPIILLTTVTQNPEFEIKGECDGTSYVLQALPIANYDVTTATFSWTAPNGSNAGNTQSIIATATGTYTCVITYQGCSGNDDEHVDRISCTIQNGISPNGDGLNESFDLSGLGVKQLSIFNRYGTKVYSKSSYTDQWKGQTDNGNELPDGTYYYVIDQSNGETKSGWIYINR